jgi:hypothetical protein
MMNNYSVANLSKLFGSFVSELNDRRAVSEGFERKTFTERTQTHMES